MPMPLKSVCQATGVPPNPLCTCINCATSAPFKTKPTIPDSEFLSDLSVSLSDLLMFAPSIPQLMMAA